MTTNNTHVLAIFRDNWADEMDVEGWAIMTAEDWQSNMDAMKEAFEIRDSIEIYFGTNESNDYTFDQLKRKITTKQITEEEAKTVKRLFGSYDHGHTEFAEFECYLEEIKADEGIDDEVDEDEFDEDEDF